MLHSGDFDFSFSGLKTAVLTVVRQGPMTESGTADLAAEFQEAVTEVLAAKAIGAVRHCGLNTLVVAGGVGANRRLRERLDKAAARAGIKVHYPALDLCTDNGAMIAFCGAQRLLAGLAARSDGAFSVRPRWPLEELA
jgi:N6-L-threonylcarbamoyladenine synthase